MTTDNLTSADDDEQKHKTVPNFEHSIADTFRSFMRTELLCVYEPQQTLGWGCCNVNRLKHPPPSSNLLLTVTKDINWQQFTKGMRGKPNEQLFPR